jgi:hypothetical protein
MPVTKSKLWHLYFLLPTIKNICKDMANKNRILIKVEYFLETKRKALIKKLRNL